jgi:NTE family protein
LHRHDVFPITWRTLLGFIWRRDFLIPHDGVQKLIDDHLPYRNLQDAKLPVHIVTTDLVSGDSVVLSEGSAAEAIIASTAIPGRSATRIFIWPTARSPPTRRSGSRWQRGRTA